MGLPAFLGLGVTAAALVALCAGDPKRRRAARLSGATHSPTTRRMLVAGALLPGLGFVVAGEGAALLIWLGGSAIFGWLLTLVFSRRRDPA